jgi:hypothetical protein
LTINVVVGGFDPGATDIVDDDKDAGKAAVGAAKQAFGSNDTALFTHNNTINDER